MRFFSPFNLFHILCALFTAIAASPIRMLNPAVQGGPCRSFLWFALWRLVLRFLSKIANLLSLNKCRHQSNPPILCLRSMLSHECIRENFFILSAVAVGIAVQQKRSVRLPAAHTRTHIKHSRILKSYVCSLRSSGFLPVRTGRMRVPSWRDLEYSALFSRLEICFFIFWMYFYLTITDIQEAEQSDF